MFQSVSLSWNGKDYAIPADRMMGAIASIEVHLTLGELMQQSQGGKPKLASLAQAYGALLEYAGVKKEKRFDTFADEVYIAMFGNADGAKIVGAATRVLIAIMIPPTGVAESLGEQTKGNGNREARRAASASLRKRTKRPTRGE